MASNLNKLVQPECGAPNPLVAAAQRIATKSTVARPSFSAQRYQRAPASLQPQSLNFAKEFAQREPPPLKFSQTGAPVSTNQSSVQFQQQASSTSSQHQPQPPMQMINHIAAHPRLTDPFGAYPHQQVSQQQQQQHHHGVASMSSSISAGDQLETKYRNDMISQSASSSSSTGVKAMGKLDDVEYWQSLAQAYMGPNTYSTIAELGARMRAKEADNQTTTDTKAGAASDKPLGVEELAELTHIKTEYDDQLEEVTSWPDQEEEEEAAKLIDSMRLEAGNELEYTFDERNPLKDQYENPFEEGLRRLEQGDIPSAALLFEASVQREPENALAWRYLGTTQAQNEMDKSAIRALRNCLHLDPSDQQARMAIAVSLVNETQHREACRHLHEWLMKHERYGGIISPSSLSSSSSAQQQQQSFQALEEELAGIQEVDPLAAVSQYSQIDKLGEQVRQKFVQAVRMAPNDPDPEVQNALGVLFNMRGDYAKAVDCFKAALSVRQQDSLLWNRLGATLANGNKSDEAVIAYRRALEISPGFLRSRYNLAISLIHLNLYEEAAKQLIQILNTQAAGQGSRSERAIRTRSITSTSIWNTLRTVATLMNKPDLYPLIDGRDLSKCNELVLSGGGGSYTTATS